MSEGINQQEYDYVRNFISQECGITIGDSRQYLIETRIGKLLKSYECSSYIQLVNKAKEGEKNHIRDAIIDAITTNETLWFRDTHPFEALTEHIIPERIMKVGKTGLNFWSAASSTGQEAYSIAITLMEYRKKNPLIGSPGLPIKIVGTDISPSALFTAMSARYDELSTNRGLSEERLAKFFSKQGRHYQLSMDVKKYVQFKQLNLQESFAGLGRFDVVMLRNVLIYFAQDLRVSILTRIRDIMRPGGYLMVGTAENLPPGVEGFEQLRVGRTVLYKKVD